MRWFLAIIAVTFIGFTACTKKNAEPVTGQNPVEEVDKDLAHLPVSIDTRILDASVSPCDDFYQYACGNWLKQIEIPTGKPRWSRSFDNINQDNQNTIKTVVDNYSSGKIEPATPFATKVGDYYSACMDTDSIEQSAIKFLPLQLAKIDKIESKNEFISGLAGWHSRGVSVFFALYAEQDRGDARQMIGTIDRSGLGLPDRDYYTKTDEDSLQLKKEYTAHVGRLLALAKISPDKKTSEATASKIVAFETKMAEKMLTIEQRRDPLSTYHLVGLEGLKGMAADLNWDAYFENSGHPDLKQLSVAEPDYFKALNALLAEQTLDELKTYLKFEVVRAYASALNKAITDESFDFNGKTLLGLQEQQARWKTCLESTEGALGEAIGEAFVKLKFNEESRTRTRQMIEHLRTAVSENFKGLNWMDEPTRVMAQTKLAKINNKVGYPEKFRDYSGLDVDRQHYVDNIVSANAFERRRDLAKVGKQVDRAEWGMTPQTVNAYYSPEMNEIVFPAAILQPPFFHLTSPLASNFGGIMMVIGHETTHAFDDSGRKYDELGNLRNWWSLPVAESFKTRADCLVKQYDSYVVADGTVHLSGQKTLGENIADLGGLKLSWVAYQKAKQGMTEKEIGGLNGDKQFFVAFAQGWCTKATVAFEKYHAKTNVHSHPKYRVNGVVVNVPGFQQTFGCSTGSGMAPANRCEVW